MSNRNPDDNMIYFVQVNYGKRIGVAWVERNPCDMDYATTLQDICDRQWRGEVIKVLECNPVENICNDVTEAFLSAAMQEVSAPSIIQVGDHAPELVRS